MLEAKLAQWVQAVLQALPALAEQSGQSEQTQRLEAISMDGKTLRGSVATLRKQGATDAHLLSALHQYIGLVLDQVAVADTSNEINALPSLGEATLTARQPRSAWKSQGKIGHSRCHVHPA